MTRPSYDETEAMRHRDAGTSGLGLFAVDNTPSWVSSWGTLTTSQQFAQRERWKEQLLPRLLDLARRNGPEGIIAADVIGDGITSGVLWGERVFLKKYPRIYAWIGPWLGQLANSGTLAPVMVELPNGGRLHVTRMSERSLSKHNKGGVYVLGKAA